ncbi:hypothetical protein RZS08_57460, partial [Arthrospira platensis SPKY1]|nr:hypothetical protein [Arthrospira platensis SPKY1]
CLFIKLLRWPLADVVWDTESARPFVRLCRTEKVTISSSSYLQGIAWRMSGRTGRRCAPSS